MQSSGKIHRERRFRGGRGCPRLLRPSGCTAAVQSNHPTGISILLTTYKKREPPNGPKNMHLRVCVHTCAREKVKSTTKSLSTSNGLNARSQWSGRPRWLRPSGRLEAGEGERERERDRRRTPSTKKRARMFRESAKRPLVHFSHRKKKCARKKTNPRATPNNSSHSRATQAAGA